MSEQELVQHEMMELLAKLGFNASKKPSGERILKRIEREYEVVLPPLYRFFLLNYKQSLSDQEIAYPCQEPPPWSGNGRTLTLDGFLLAAAGNESLEETIDNYYDRLPAALVPLSVDMAGNLICIGVSDEATGKIYFWDHENELEARLMLQEDLGDITVDDYWDNLYLIADSFLDFIRSMFIVEE